jgi:hypothetical protein
VGQAADGFGDLEDQWREMGALEADGEADLQLRTEVRLGHVREAF